MKKLTGSICALATPFTQANAGDAVDFDAYARLIEQQLAGGTQALVVAGSTGEAHALEQSEYDRLLTCTLEQVAGRVPVLAGTGTANTRTTIRATKHAAALGADAALVVTPYYVRPTQYGLQRHYSEIADHGDLPIVLYNVPSRTGCDLLPQTVAALSVHERIIAIKEARGDAERVAALVALKNPHFSILSGDDPSCMQAMLAGAQGVISVAANVAPSWLSALCDASLRGQVAHASALNDKLRGLYDLLGAEPNPIPLKWCLSLLGLGSSSPRLPLLPLSAEHHESARAVMAALTALPATVQPAHSHAA